MKKTMKKTIQKYVKMIQKSNGKQKDQKTKARTQ